MLRSLLLLHFLALALGLGGLVSQILILGRFHNSAQPIDRVASERMATAIVAGVQNPGVYLAIATGLVLAWLDDWSALHLGWLQFKLLFVFWILLATRLMARNSKNIEALRQQAGPEDSLRLRSLKDNYLVIGYVTVLAFVFAIILSIWKPF